MEEGSRRGIYEERIPLCRRGSSGSCRSSLSRPLEIFLGERERKEERRRSRGLEREEAKEKQSMFLESKEAAGRYC